MADSLHQRQSPTPEHHALLFAYLAREVIDELGEERGGKVLERAVWQYGVERGRRMALRAQADGRVLDYRTYLAYGEWRHVLEAGRSPSQSETLATSPDLHKRVMTCPWNQAWRDEGLLRYGEHYCRHIDRALVHGFSPQLVLEVTETLSGGGPWCDFFYRGADLTAQDLTDIAAEAQALAPITVMPWSYHLGHLYATMGQVIATETGPMGELLVSDGIKAFTARFPQAACVAASYLGADFSIVASP